jgi:hypothetical protein
MEGALDELQVARIGGVVLEVADPAAASHTATPSKQATPPDSPYTNAIAIAACAARDNAGTGDRLATPAEVAAAMQKSAAVQTSKGWYGFVPRPPSQSPGGIDFQNYFHSPAASSSGLGSHMSPLDGPAASASDCVPYNEMYGAVSGRSVVPTPFRRPSALGRLGCTPVGAVRRMDTVGSATDSLFSLMPSDEPPSRQQSQPVADCGSRGDPAPQRLVWQVRLQRS